MLACAARRRRRRADGASSPTRPAPCSASGSPAGIAALRSSTSTARSASTSSPPPTSTARRPSTARYSVGKSSTSTGAPMWALAGYGDFLEQRTPGMRENMAQMGAPERFEDVVASCNPVADGNAPRWTSASPSTTPTRSPPERPSSVAGFSLPPLRCAVVPDDRDRRPARRHVHRQRVRAENKNQAPRAAGPPRPEPP